VFQYYEDVLPYWKFSLRLSKADLPRLPSILEGLSDEYVCCPRRSSELPGCLPPPCPARGLLLYSQALQCRCLLLYLFLPDMHH
jgi:hypothetical protein